MQPKKQKTLETAAFIQSLPKTETHLHIEGALPWECLQSLDPQKYKEPPLSWEASFRFRDFAQFETELIGYAAAWYTSAGRYHEAAKRIFARHLQQNVKYVETSFASAMLQWKGLCGAEVAAAIKAAAPPGLEVRVFMGLHRTGEDSWLHKLCNDALNWEALDGIDLHGDETLPLEKWSCLLWQRAREAGKMTKAHAGEFGGADSVSTVIKQLGIRRIEHGIRAFEDKKLVHQLCELGVVLDICPISNLKLGVIGSMAEHPIRQLYDAGVSCTLSTDDPISFGNTVGQEYQMLADHLAFSRSELCHIARNGFEAALMTDAQKQPYLDELDALNQESTKNSFQ